MKYAFLIILIFASVRLFAQSQTTGSDNNILDDTRYEQVTQSTSVASDLSAAIRPFNYKQTKEWKRFKLMTWLGGSSLVLGGAASILGLGLALGNTYSDTSTYRKNYGGQILCWSGLVFMAGSIPLFIIAANNYSKAKKMQVSLTTLSGANLKGFRSTPGVSLAITF